MARHSDRPAKRATLASHTVPGLFVAQAARTPDTPAVRCEGREWTYAEWASSVNRLTRWLTARGVGRDTLVPIVMGPRPDALHAMLAVMQAGAAYVPLDPAYGSQRIAAVLDEIGSRSVLTSAAALEH